MGVLVPSVDVVLDRPRRLVEDYAALAAFEEETGLNAHDPATYVRTKHWPPSPCLHCGHKAKAQMDRTGPGIVWRCKQCGGRWAASTKEDALTATTFSAYVWALLLRDDPQVSLDDVRAWLGDPKVLTRAKQAVQALEIAEAERALAPDDDEGEGGDGDPKSPPGTTSSG